MGPCTPSFHRGPAGTFLVASLPPRISLDFWPFSGKIWKASCPWDLREGHRHIRRLLCTLHSPTHPAMGQVEMVKMPQEISLKTRTPKGYVQSIQKESCKGWSGCQGQGTSLHVLNSLEGSLVQSWIPDQTSRTSRSLYSTWIWWETGSQSSCRFLIQNPPECYLLKSVFNETPRSHLRS